jgi:hypothetical protein
MRASRLTLFGAVALLVFTGAAGFAQVVISTQAGLINHTQGGVRLNDQAVESRRGQFQQMRQQDVLSTIQGRAEVLLNPGVFMRLGENSSFRLVSSQITDARVELVSGTAIVEANEVNKDTAVTLSCQQAEVSILKRGVYRLDANPPTVRVFDGKVLVRSAGQQMEIGRGKAVALDGTLALAKFDRKRGDWLDLWSRDRASYLADLNLSTARSLRTQRGLGRISGWAFNPYFGVYTFMPGNGYYCSWYGSCYYSPRQVYYATSPRVSSGWDSSSSGGGGGSRSSGSSISPGAWSAGSPGAATGSASREAPPAQSSPAPSRGGGGRAGP